MVNKIEVELPTKTFTDIEAFLFDLDGTLIDSLDLHIEAFQWILKKLGKNVSKSTLEPLMGRTPQDIINEFFSDLSRDELLKAASQKENHLAKIIDSVYVYPGIEEFLIKLQSNRIKNIVISSTHKDLVKLLLDKAGLLRYMTAIVSGDEVRSGKPDPEPFNLGVKKASTSHNHVIGIGDSIHDYQSAKSAGIHFVGILTGKTDRKTFEKLGVQYIIEKISDIKIKHD